MARGAGSACRNRSNPAAIHSFHKPVHSRTANVVLFSAHRTLSRPEPVDNHVVAGRLDQHPGPPPSEVPRPSNRCVNADDSPGDTPPRYRGGVRGRGSRRGSRQGFLYRGFPHATTLKPPSPGGYDRGHQRAVTDFTALDEQPSRDAAMTSPSFDSGSARELPWSSCASAWSRSYTLAAARAGAIALVLLGVLALIVWF